MSILKNVAEVLIGMGLMVLIFGPIFVLGYFMEYLGAPDWSISLVIFGYTLAVMVYFLMNAMSCHAFSPFRRSLND